MPYTVIEVLEVDEGDWEPTPLTQAERIARSAEGTDPCAAGNDSLFTIKTGP